MSEPMPPPEPTASQPDSTRTGPGRLLIAVYALFALSASARAGVQIATKFHHAPVAYLLSAFAAVVYVLATVWSSYGSGYGFVPLVLPVFGLLWLYRWNRGASQGAKDVVAETKEPVP